MAVHHPSSTSGPQAITVARRTGDLRTVLELAPAGACWRQAAFAALIALSILMPLGAGAATPGPAPTVEIKLLAFNDFHGQLESGTSTAGRATGGAAVLASWLRDAERGKEDRTFIVHAGDQIGASPASSNLLKDEPAIAFLNLLANPHCLGPFAAPSPRCNVIGTLGNHELDRGKQELQRVLGGGDHPEGPFLEHPWRGARFPVVSANVLDRKTKKPWLRPYVIQEAAGVRIAFVGALTAETRTIVSPGGISDLEIEDEAPAVNRAVAEIKGKGVRAIVLLIHEGGRQEGPNAPVIGKIGGIVDQLDGEVDVVISGHVHAYTNTVLHNAGKKEVLVTQAFDKGRAFADITLEIDRKTGDVVKKSGRIVTTFDDEGPGLKPDPKVADLAARARKMVAPRAKRVIATMAAEVSRAPNAVGESALGSLIADAHRASVDAQIGFMNPGGIRTELRAGVVTWGDALAVHPFGNRVLKLAVSGRDIREVLEVQKLSGKKPRLLQVSGLRYRWDDRRPAGSRVVEVTVASTGKPLDLGATYTVAVNDFVVGGGDGHDIFKRGRLLSAGPLDIDALTAWLARLPQPVSAGTDGRISRAE